MGNSLPFLWFGKSVDELKAILETNKKLTDEEREQIEELIKEKEKENE